MYHDTIHAILSPLKSAMRTPVIRRCPDGHFRRVIYDLAAYIADYPEQVYLAGVVQNWCPKYYHSSLYIEQVSTHHIFHRCTAMNTDLDGQAGRRSHDLTAKLKEIINSKMLWEEYGIDDDITVRHSSLGFNLSHKDQAVHDPFPSCGHSQNVIARHPTPVNQGHVQGQPGAMDR